MGAEGPPGKDPLRPFRMTMSPGRATLASCWAQAKFNINRVLRHENKSNRDGPKLDGICSLTTLEFCTQDHNADHGP